MSRAPKYTGPKKNHSAIWVGEWGSSILGGKIRCLNSKGIWAWAYVNVMHQKSFDYLDQPCWTDYRETSLENEKRMRRYDAYRDMETIFLGYVRDTE